MTPKNLISQLTLFKNVAAIPKGQFPKSKGAICNISIEISDISNNLYSGADSNGLLILKVKAKKHFGGYVYFKAISPNSLYASLFYLKEKYFLYDNINIDLNDLTATSLSLNILRFCYVLVKFPFTTSETKLNYFL